MSQDEESIEFFKDKLFQSFQETGILDSVKAQLRHKMIEKLVKSQRVQSIQQRHKDEQGAYKLLTNRLMASIVAEYLEKQEYNYACSIFLPESGYANKNLARFEILEVMNAKTIDNNKQSVLESMVEVYLNNVKNVPKQNCSTQTEHADAIFNLEQRLNTVDNKFKERLSEINTPGHEIEERLSRFKKEYEARIRAETNAEIVRIREFEISTVRMEEQEKHRKSMAEYREEIEKNYMDKLNKLRERERDTLEKCSQKMKEIDTVNHQHRQRILKDFELLRMREEEVDKQRQLNEETGKVQKQKIDNYEQELKDKIRKAEEQQLIVEKKYQNDLAYTKLEAHKDLESEKLEILEKRRELDSDLSKLQTMKDTVGQFTENNKRLSEDNRKLTEELQDMKRRKKEMDLELAQFKDSLRTVSDSYRRDQDTTRNQEAKLKLKDEEILFLKGALDESKAITDQHKQGQLDSLKKFNSEIAVYQQRIEDSEKQIRDLKKTIGDLEYQLELVRKHNGASKNLTDHSQSASLGYGGGSLGLNSSGQQPQQFQFQFKSSFQKELDELKERRKQELLSLQRENDFAEKKNYNQKFDNIWDVSNSTVDFSYLKQQRQQQQQQQQQQTYLQQQQKQYNEEITRSHIYGDIGVTDKKQPLGFNLIEESFREEPYDLKLGESKGSRDSDRDLNSSKLKFLGEAERARQQDFKDPSKESSFIIKKSDRTSPAGKGRESTTQQPSDQFKTGSQKHPVSIPTHSSYDYGIGEQSPKQEGKQTSSFKQPAKEQYPPSTTGQKSLQPLQDTTQKKGGLPTVQSKKQPDWMYEDLEFDKDLKQDKPQEIASQKEYQFKQPQQPKEGKKDLFNPFGKSNFPTVTSKTASGAESKPAPVEKKSLFEEIKDDDDPISENLDYVDDFQDDY